MNHVELAIAAIAGRQHQVFSRAQAIAAGLSSSSLDRRVQSQRFVPCGVHALCFRGTTLTYRGRLMAGLLDLGPDALVSGHAAAELLELDGFTEGRLEFLVPREQRGRTTIGLVTSSPSISKLDRVAIDGLACVSCTRAIVQLLSNASERQVGNALDSGSRKRLTAPSVVRHRLDELGTQGRAGIAAFNRVMESAGVQSWLERLRPRNRAASPRHGRVRCVGRPRRDVTCLVRRLAAQSPDSGLSAATFRTGQGRAR